MNLIILVALDCISHGLSQLVARIVGAIKIATDTMLHQLVTFLSSSRQGVRKVEIPGQSKNGRLWAWILPLAQDRYITSNRNGYGIAAVVSEKVHVGVHNMA